MSGCGLFNLNGWIMPDDAEFLQVIQSINTPLKIETYVKEHFIYKEHPYYAPNPYEFWKLGEGDCNDFETFERFAGHYNGYTTYRFIVYFKGIFIKHSMAIFVENGKYNYFNIKGYREIYVETFKEVYEHYKENNTEYESKYYKIYDYEGNLIEVGSL